MNKTILSLLVLLNSSAAVSAKPARDDTAPASDSFVFQLLPNSLSKNPRLHLSYVTEMSEAGRKLPPPSPEKPTYYQAKDGGYRRMGEGSPAGEHVPPAGDLQNLITKALTKAGYQEADTTHPASLIIVFQWGAYTTPTDAPGSPPISVAIKNRQLLERAALVGGEKYARALEAAIVEASMVQDTKGTLRIDDLSGETATENVFGITTASFSDFTNPIKLFLSKSPKNQELFDLAADSCYYVIATAYDKAAYLEKKQFLALWRTKMTVAADGVSLAETVQPMIARSPRFLGRETDGAVTISRRIHEGRVDLGETKIMGVVDPAASPAEKK